MYQKAIEQLLSTNAPQELFNLESDLLNVFA